MARKKWLSVLLPAVFASLLTVLMYVGEMILLNGHLYRFGDGWLFRGLSGIVLAPIDLLVVLASGAITAGIFSRLRK